MQWESIIPMGSLYHSLDCGIMLLRSVLQVAFLQSVKSKLRIETSGKTQGSQRSWNTCGESAGSWMTGNWRNQETKKKTWNGRNRESRELSQGPLGLNLQKYETAKISWTENFKWHLCSLDMHLASPLMKMKFNFRRCGDFIRQLDSTIWCSFWQFLMGWPNMDFAVPPDFPYSQTNLGLSCAKSHSSCECWPRFLHKIQFTHPESGNNITVAKIKGIDVRNGLKT